MRQVFRLAALVFLTLSATAHDAMVPHTHSFDREHSDLFVWSLAALAIVAGMTLIVWLRHRRQNAETPICRIDPPERPATPPGEAT